MKQPSSPASEPAGILDGRGKRETLAKIIVGGMSDGGYISVLEPELWPDGYDSCQRGGFKRDDRVERSTRHQTVIGKGAVVVRGDDQMIENGNIQQFSALFQFARQDFVGFAGL